MNRRWLVPFGTRPEIVKLAPVVEAMRASGATVETLATGQHGDTRLADQFFDDLALEPDARWELPHNEADRVGSMLGSAYETLASGAHDAVLVVGDTHTVPFFALAARRFGLPIVHVEAGLRSFNARSVEEGNRKVAAALASLHLAPTHLAARMLAAEGLAAERVFVVGNPVTDSLRSLGPPRCAPDDRKGAIVTMHRSTNVDDPARLGSLIEFVRALGEEVGDVRFPLHPRTRDRLGRAGCKSLSNATGITLEPPLRYRDMLDAVATSKVVVTDSGGLQEEAAWYGVPAVVLRNSTPRWESVISGTAVLVGADGERALEAVRVFGSPAEQERVAAVPCPYGDGYVGARIAALLTSPDIDVLLDVAEPTLDANQPLLSDRLA